jgi:hypothetical protein
MSYYSNFDREFLRYLMLKLKLKKTKKTSLNKSPTKSTECLGSSPIKTTPLNIRQPETACFGPGKRQCLVCRSKGQTPMFVDVVKGGICVAKCSTGLFVQNATTCIECPSHCDVCSDNVCMSCAKNFVLSTDKKCVPTCPDGHFSDVPTRSCVACHETCSTCVGPRPSQCGLCKDNLFYYERSCVDKCPSGFFADAGNLFKSFSFLSLSM